MKFLPTIQKSFVDAAGVPLDGGKIHVIKSGTTEDADLYSDADGTGFAQNPYTLDVSGSFRFFVDADVDLDYFIYDCDGARRYSYKNIRVNPCENGGGSGPSGDVEWDYIKNKPSTFPPSAHRHNVSEIDDLPEVPTKVSELDNDSGYITGVLVSEGLYYTSDGKLTTVEPEGNFIDITNEWVFMNGFRLQYNGSTPGEGNDMRILYSPVSDIVKFTSSCRINSTNPLINNWNRILRYTGDRFYTTYNAPNVDLAPAVGLTGALGGIAYTIATDAKGGSQPGLLRIAYVGSPTVSIDETGIGINPFLSSGSTTFYGCILQNLVLKVHKKV